MYFSGSMEIFWKISKNFTQNIFLEKLHHHLQVVPAGNIQGMRVWLTDQNGEQLNLRGETVTIRFLTHSA